MNDPSYRNPTDRHNTEYKVYNLNDPSYRNSTDRYNIQYKVYNVNDPHTEILRTGIIFNIRYIM